LSRADDEPPYYIQRFVTSPEDPLTIEDSLRGYGVLGTLIAALPNAATGIDRIRQAFAASNDCYAGASLLPGDGVIIQVLSSRADAARRVLHAAQYAILGAADD
jgi:urease accessory protein UreH